MGGFGMIFGLMFLVLTLVVLFAFIPVIQQLISEQRGYDNLNCVSSKNVCGPTQLNTYCYNATLETETTSCLIFSIYTPFILVTVLIGGLSALLYNRYSAPQQQQQQGYSGY